MQAFLNKLKLNLKVLLKASRILLMYVIVILCARGTNFYLKKFVEFATKTFPDCDPTELREFVIIIATRFSNFCPIVLPTFRAEAYIYPLCEYAVETIAASTTHPSPLFYKAATAVSQVVARAVVEWIKERALHNTGSPPKAKLGQFMRSLFQSNTVANLLQVVTRVAAEQTLSRLKDSDEGAYENDIGVTRLLNHIIVPVAIKASQYGLNLLKSYIQSIDDEIYRSLGDINETVEEQVYDAIRHLDLHSQTVVPLATESAIEFSKEEVHIIVRI